MYVGSVGISPTFDGLPGPGVFAKSHGVLTTRRRTPGRTRVIGYARLEKKENSRGRDKSNNHNRRDKAAKFVICLTLHEKKETPKNARPTRRPSAGVLVVLGMTVSRHVFSILSPFPINHTPHIPLAAMSGRIKRKAADTATPDPKKARSITAFFSSSGEASSSSNTPASPVPKFDKQKWISKLSDEQRSLLSLEINTMHNSWLGALKEELVTPDFLSLKRFLQSEKEKGMRIYPPEGDIYSW